MTPSAVRTALGISLRDLAMHLGCNRATLKRFELDPKRGVQGETKRLALAAFYERLCEIVDATKGSARAGR